MKRCRNKLIKVTGKYTPQKACRENTDQRVVPFKKPEKKFDTRLLFKFLGAIQRKRKKLDWQYLFERCRPLTKHQVINLVKNNFPNLID